MLTTPDDFHSLCVRKSPTSRTLNCHDPRKVPRFLRYYDGRRHAGKSNAESLHDHVHTSSSTSAPLSYGLSHFPSQGQAEDPSRQTGGERLRHWSPMVRQRGVAMLHRVPGRGVSKKEVSVDCKVWPQSRICVAPYDTYS